MQFDRIQTQRWFGYILLICAIGAFILLIKPIVHILLIAGLTAYFVRPLYDWLCGRSYISNRLAMVLIRVMMICCVVGPGLLFAQFILNQLVDVMTEVSGRWNVDTIENTDLSQYGVIEKINGRLAAIPGKSLQINKAFVYDKIGVMAQWAGTQASGGARAIGSIIGNGITNTILYIIVVSGLLMHRYDLGRYLINTIPLDAQTLKLYRVHLVGMGTSMAKATIVIAAFQAIITGISFGIVGIEYALLRTIVAFILCMIPMIGSAFIVVPVAVILLISGQMWSGILLLAVNVLLTNTIDNVLRPKLVAKEAQINETMLLISVFGGMALFGMRGIMYGPVLMSFILVTFEAYRKHRV